MRIVQLTAAGAPLVDAAAPDPQPSGVEVWWPSAPQASATATSTTGPGHPPQSGCRWYLDTKWQASSQPWATGFGSSRVSGSLRSG